MLTENPLGITMLSRTEITKYYSKYLISISTLNLFYDEKKICIAVMYLTYLNVVANRKFSFKKSNKGSLITISAYRGLAYHISN